MLKDRIITVFIFILIPLSLVVSALYLFGPIPISVNQTTTEKSAPFQVTGKGTAEAPPEEAIAILGVTETSPTAKASQEQANAVINKIKASLEGLGVQKKDIKTTAYNIYPSYSFEKGVESYITSINLEVKFSNFDYLDKAIDMAVSNKANLIGPLKFKLSNETRKRLEQEARLAAVKDARERAKRVAEATDVTLGRIINVQETVSSDEPPGAISLSAERSLDSSTQIYPGVSAVTVQTTLSFEIR